MEQLIKLRNKIINLKKIEVDIGINKEKIAAYNEILVLIKRML